MGLVSDSVAYTRFAVGLRRFLREIPTPAQAEEIVRRRLTERKENFLLVAEKAVYGYAKSPYLTLLREARCELGDLRNAVRRKGLETALRDLREAGVYITFEEFKGRKPIRRFGKTWPVAQKDFDNPFLRRYFYGRTSGTTGPGTRFPVDLETIAARQPMRLLARIAQGIHNVPVAIWRGVPPTNMVGVKNILGNAKLGNVPLKWFTPITFDDRPSWKHRLYVEGIVRLGRLHGVPFPYPETVRLDEAVVIARWLEEMVRAHGKCYLSTFGSMSLRVAVAALDEGIDLTGAVLSLGGEPPTEAKASAVRRSGARPLGNYNISELGGVGKACMNPIGENDQHFMKDRLALIQHPRLAPGTEIEVPALLFTTIVPEMNKIFLNVETDDYGTVETRSCGCPFEGYGLTEHIRDIRSFRKLAGEGMTLVGSEMERILEEVLPARFGGTPLDYQLVEREDEQGFTRLLLMVHPRLSIENEAEVVETMLTALGKSSKLAGGAATIWRQAKAIRVHREPPVTTGAGKLLPLRLERREPGSSLPAGRVPDRVSRG